MGDQLLSVTGNIPVLAMFFVGGDLDSHVGANADGCDEIHSGYGFGERNVDGD